MLLFAIDRKVFLSRVGSMSSATNCHTSSLSHIPPPPLATLTCLLAETIEETKGSGDEVTEAGIVILAVGDIGTNQEEGQVGRVVHAMGETETEIAEEVRLLFLASNFIGLLLVL